MKNLECQKISWSVVKLLIKELIKGKSFWRTLMNYNLSSVKLHGRVLDLGAGSSKASYNRFLKKQPETEIVYTDLYKDGDNVIRLDLEAKFPISDGSYDSITCFNVLEHVYDYGNLLQESYRVLKRDGLFIGATPFLINYHPDPNDYFRYTHQALKKIFEDHSFEMVKMVYVGFGPFTAGLAQYMLIFPKIVRPLVIFPGILLDIIVCKLSKGYRCRHPLGYVYIFKKK